ncbi:MAG: GC-type dockerin domain-anchored protein [Planctomycetota bacterium]
MAIATPDLCLAAVCVGFALSASTSAGQEHGWDYLATLEAHPDIADAPPGSSNQNYGLAMNADVVAVGVPRYADGGDVHGAVYLFSRHDGSYIASIKPTDTPPELLRFARDIQIDETTLFVQSASYENGQVLNSNFIGSHVQAFDLASGDQLWTTFAPSESFNTLNLAMSRDYVVTRTPTDRHEWGHVIDKQKGQLLRSIPVPDAAFDESARTSLVRGNVAYFSVAHLGTVYEVDLATAGVLDTWALLPYDPYLGADLVFAGDDAGFVMSSTAYPKDCGSGTLYATDAATRTRGDAYEQPVMDIPEYLRLGVSGSQVIAEMRSGTACYSHSPHYIHVFDRTDRSHIGELFAWDGGNPREFLVDGDTLVLTTRACDIDEIMIYTRDASGPTCLPDTNGDGQLSPNDFNAWILAFNNQSPACDQNGDGDCRQNDFNAWILNFNAGC